MAAAAGKMREQLFPDVANFSSKFDLPPSWHRPRVWFGEPPSARFRGRHLAEFALQLRKPFTQSLDENNLKPWVGAVVKKCDRSSGVFPPLVLYDSFHEASKIYGRSTLLNGKLKATSDCVYNNRRTTGKGSSPNVAFDAKRPDHGRRVSKLIENFKRGMGNLSYYHVPQNHKYAESPPCLPSPRFEDKSWAILNAALAKERASQLQTDEASPKFRTGSITVGISHDKSIDQNCRPTTSMSRTISATPERGIAETKSPFGGRRDPRSSLDAGKENSLKTLDVRYREEEKEESRSKNDHAVQTAKVPTTFGFEGQDEHISSRVQCRSVSTPYPSEPGFRPRRRPSQVGQKLSQSKPADKFKMKLPVCCTSSTRRARQHVPRSGSLLQSPTVSSRRKADARLEIYPIARALHRRKELKVSGMGLKRNMGISRIARPGSCHVVRDSKFAVPAYPSSNSSPRPEGTAPVLVKDGAAFSPTIRRSGEPKDATLDILFPVVGHACLKHFGRFRGNDSTAAVGGSASKGGKPRDQNFDRSSIFSACKNRANLETKAYEPLDRRRALGVIGRIIDDNHSTLQELCVDVR